MDIDVIRIHNHVCCWAELVKYRPPPITYIPIKEGKGENVYGYCDSRFRGLIVMTHVNCNDALLSRAY